MKFAMKLINALVVLVFHGNVFADFFPYKNIAFAGSCDNPTSIVMWRQYGNNNGLIRYTYNYSNDQYSRIISNLGAYVFSYGIHILYNDLDGIRGNDLIDVYDFNSLGYRVKERKKDEKNYMIRNYKTLSTGVDSQIIYKCQPTSIASIAINKKINELEQNNINEKEKLLERQRQASIIIGAEIKLKNNKLLANCKGIPSMHRNVLEELSRDLRTQPNLLSVNRVNYIKTEWDLEAQCNATIYYASGVCSVPVAFDNRGVINQLLRECK